MNTLSFASCLLAITTAAPGYPGGAHISYNAIPVATVVSSQYHSQDKLGQYNYGYSGDTSSKHETKTLDGVTRGGYSYLDAHGLEQSARYESDPVHGFRVVATNLPVGPSVADAPLPVTDTPEVAAAKFAHYQAHAEVKGHILGRKRRSPGYLGAAGAPTAGPSHGFSYSSVADDHVPAIGAGHGFTYSSVADHHVPAVGAGHGFAYASVAAHPVHAIGAGHGFAHSLAAHIAASHGDAHVSSPVTVSTSNQYKTQDGLGQYSYGYDDGNSIKHESRATDGSTNGAYSYVDGHGQVQSVMYHADAHGFHAVGTNIPMAH